MENTLEVFDKKLAALKTEIDSTKDMLKLTNNKREELLPFVKEHQELSAVRKGLQKEIRAKEKSLNTILDFIESSTGEKSYAIFPLFGGQNRNVPAVN